MNETSSRFNRQRGMALVLSLLLLFVMVTIGVAGFGNTHLQERSASNARLQTEAFKAAAAGAADSINFFVANRDRTDINITDDLCGTFGHEGWYDADGDPVPSDWVEVGNVGLATLSQRLYCLADAYPCGEEDEDLGFDCDEVNRPARSQLFVLSHGEVVVDGKVVASRDIEVRLGLVQEVDTGDGCGALCFPGCQIDGDNTNFPNSNSFQVDGGDQGGYAITVGCEEGWETILDEIRDNRIGNYEGGVGTSEPGSPWTEDTIAAFREGVEEAALTQPDCSDCYFGSGLSTAGNATFGSAENPQITFVEGDANINGTISGAGIFLVTGDLIMSGTPAYQGLIVVLGGDWQISGGGGGGNPLGSVVVLNVTADGTFGDISFDVNGGGNALYQYDCNTLMAARELLEGTEAYGMWTPECENSSNLDGLGPERIIIASWRENIGWREELFAD